MTSQLNEKTEQEWKTSIHELLKGCSKHYTSGNLEGMKTLMTEDIHRMGPGRPTMKGTDAARIQADTCFEMLLEEIRWYSRDAAVIEFKVKFDHESKAVRAKGMALVVDTDEKVLLKSVIWNVDRKVWPEESSKIDWKNDIVELLEKVSTHYSSGNLEAMKDLVTEDVHRMGPGRPTMVGREAVDIKPGYNLKMILDEVRWYSGSGAVFEYSGVKVADKNRIVKKGMALVVETDGNVLIKSNIWNI